MKHRFAIFLVILAFAAVASAEVFSISGTVFSSAAQEPLAKAAVLVNGVVFAESNLKGEFELPQVVPADVIRVQKTGYVGVSAVAGAENEELNFQLAPIWELESAFQIYEDVPVYAWFEPAVRKLYETQTLSARGLQEFRPGEFLTRGELAVLAVQAAGFLTETPEATQFCDVQPGDDFAGAVEFMFAHDWLTGYASNECPAGRVFRPQLPVNRAEAVKMALIAFHDLVERRVEERVCLSSAFSDVPPNAWFTPFVDQANCLEFIHGYPDGSFRPANPVNRAEIAVILANALESLF